MTERREGTTYKRMELEGEGSWSIGGYEMRVGRVPYENMNHVKSYRETISDVHVLRL